MFIAQPLLRREGAMNACRHIIHCLPHAAVSQETCLERATCCGPGEFSLQPGGVIRWRSDLHVLHAALVLFARRIAKGHLMKTLAKLPVTIVTGFLGSGKTTLLRHMLDNAEGRRIAVIVNEFGELGIDGEILKQCTIGCTEEEANGRVYELANGCLCCTVQEEFFPVMRELVARRGDLDHILIETSGLALPKPLVRLFNGRKSATPARSMR